MEKFNQKSVRELKRGEYFRLKDSETSPVWVRGEYISSEKKYSIYKREDVNQERLMKGNTLVFVDFAY